MTQVAEPNPPSDRPSRDRPHDVCPFLLAGGAWRSAAPARDHRCLAVGDDMQLSLDKQKRLCLTTSHRSCPAYRAALGLDASTEAGGRSRDLAPRRPYPRMAPVVVDHGRIGMGAWAAARERPAGQLALGMLMVVAFGAIALARLTSIDGGPAVAATSPTPPATIAAAQPSPTPTPRPTPTPSAAPSAEVTAAASPTPELRTYKVKRGDTLIAIAARFGTTVRQLVRLNDIKDPSRIPVGAVLDIPSEASEP